MDRRLRRAWAILGSAVFLVIAPGFVAGVVPWWISRWEIHEAFFGIAALRFLGWALIALGSIGLLDCFRRFAFEGLGTPAPVFPTEHLVATGLYRFVRNPMYVSVVSAILGQALVFGNVHVAEYGAIVWLIFHAWVLIYEEPTLTASFGHEYTRYCAAVRRWIPRTRPFA